MHCELPEVFNEKMVKARKPHKCCECATEIEAASEYQRSSGIWNDAGAKTYKTCKRCARIRDAAVREMDGGYDEHGPGFGLLFSWIRDGCERHEDAEGLIRRFAEEKQSGSDKR